MNNPRKFRDLLQPVYPSLVSEPDSGRVYDYHPQGHHPTDVEFIPTPFGRFGSNTQWKKNTFQTVQADITSHFYISEKSRFENHFLPIRDEVGERKREQYQNRLKTRIRYKNKSSWWPEETVASSKL